MSDVRFVLDTNLLVSAALFPRSLARKAFDAVLRTDGLILISEAVLAEITEVFGRSRFDRYVTAAVRQQFLSELLALVMMVQIVETTAVCRDPKDDKFLELAVSGQANYILTSDKDLLVLHPFRGVKIITPVDFLGVMS
jgi:uncharacterized protein